ncbi:hypothetical protein OE88DRAFT_1642894 [Heliocybe sulcata]|uniref:Uncharacterized protein n=1 Tax=Heliocybe sulcata TaxID=5364 RepID=A0A5C3NAK1_9AGAM|nr:hypothetical protein OE88DRAFT_1642894 [Heliocybe sulcata]
MPILSDPSLLCQTACCAVPPPPTFPYSPCTTILPAYMDAHPPPHQATYAATAMIFWFRPSRPELHYFPSRGPTPGTMRVLNTLFEGRPFCSFNIPHSPDGHHLHRPITVWFEELAFAQAGHDLLPHNESILRLTDGGLRMRGLVLIGCWESGPEIVEDNLVVTAEDVYFALNYLLYIHYNPAPVPNL